MLNLSVVGACRFERVDRAAPPFPTPVHQVKNFLTTLQSVLQHVRLRWMLLLFLVVFGSLPLLLNLALTLGPNQGLLARQEQEKLTRRLELLSSRAGDDVEAMRGHLELAAAGLSSLDVENALTPEAADWSHGYLERFQRATANRFASRVVDLLDGRAQRTEEARVQLALDRTLDLIRTSDRRAHWQLLDLGAEREPLVVYSVPVVLEDGETLGWVIQGVLRLDLEGREQGDVFVLDLASEGRVVWSTSLDDDLRRSVASSEMVTAFLSLPEERDLIPVTEYDAVTGGETVRMLGQVARIGDSNWALMVQQPRAKAFFEVRRWVLTSLGSAGIMVVVAFLFAAIAARGFTVPLERLAHTAHDISCGEFGKKIEPVAFGAEMTELAESFNAMSDQIDEHVDQLRQAAALNRDLFIGSIRAFLAAIEAKEPYTRGHSERVASFSQAIARQLNMSREFQERIWIAGLMHDVGKIGIDDRVLKKGDKLTDEEYEEMKRHPAVGAEIMTSIEQLRDMLPAIRWHHEDWAGTGYPDGLAGEDIPLMARIVAVADTFDAITTQRVYQDPYTDEEAVGIIENLIGKRFDPRVAEAFVYAFKVGDIVTDRAVDNDLEIDAELLRTRALHT